MINYLPVQFFGAMYNSAPKKKKKRKRKRKIGMNNNSKEGMKFQDTVIQWTTILQFNCKNSKEGISETEMGHNSKAINFYFFIFFVFVLTFIVPNSNSPIPNPMLRASPA